MRYRSIRISSIWVSASIGPRSRTEPNYWSRRIRSTELRSGHSRGLSRKFPVPPFWNRPIRKKACVTMQLKRGCLKLIGQPLVSSEFVRNICCPAHVFFVSRHNSDESTPPRYESDSCKYVVVLRAMALSRLQSVGSLRRSGRARPPDRSKSGWFGMSQRMRNRSSYVPDGAFSERPSDWKFPWIGCRIMFVAWSGRNAILSLGWVNGSA